MNERKIVKTKFDFLIDYGFKYSYEKDSNISFTLEYQKDDIVIIPGYDFREHDFSVSLRDVNNKDVLNLHVNILKTRIGTLDKKLKLEQSLKNIIINSEKHHHGMPKKDFESIVTLYADFVKDNIEDIINWKY